MSFKLADALVYLGVKKDGRLQRDLNQAQRETTSWTRSVGDGIAIALGDRIIGAVQGGIRAVGNLGRSVVTYSLDSQRAVGNLQAQLGASRAEAEALGAVAQAVWRNNFGQSVVEAADLVGQVRAQIRSLNAEQLQQVTQAGFAIRDTYGQQLPKYVSAVNSLMTTMGLTHKEAMDFIAAGYQRGLNRSDDFLDSINEYAPQFAAMEAGAGQFFSVLETGLSGGVLGTDKAADMIKEFRVRLLDGSETTAEGLRQLGLSIDDVTGRINDGSLTWAEAFDLVTGRLRESDDQAVQMQAGVALLGTQFEDLGTQAALGVDLAATSLAELEGASDALYQRYNNLGDAAAGMGRKLTASLAPASGVILDLINDNLPRLDSFFKRLEGNAATMAAGLVGIVRGLAAAFRAFFGGVRQDGDREMGATASAAGGWGRNIVLQLAKGMAAAAVAVVRVLNQIGQIITHWLKGRSPPRLLPDIDKWGTAAMQAYLDGFGSADVGVLKGMKARIGTILQSGLKAADVGLFSTISQAVGGLLQSSAGDDDKGLVGRLLGSRQAIAQALATIRQTGDVGGAAFGLIDKALAPLPAAARDYTRAMLRLHVANDRVARAQERLNAITADYSARLSPLRQELDALQRAQADEADAKRIAELQRAIARGALTDEEKVLAQRELRELQLRRQIRGIEAEQTAAEAAAQAELDQAEAQRLAAQEAADLQTALLQAQQENQSLLGRQVALLDQLAKKMAAVGGALSDLAGGAGGAGLGAALDGLALPEDPLGLGDEDDPLGLDSLADDLDIQSLVDDILDTFDPLQTEMGNLGETAGTLRDAWDGWLQRLGIANEEGQVTVDVLGFLTDGVVTLGGAFVAAKIAGFLAAIAGGFAGLSGAGGILGAIGAAVAALGGPFVVLAALVAGVVAAWKTDFLGVQTTLVGLWQQLSTIFALLGAMLSAWFTRKTEQARQFAGDVVAFFQRLARGINTYLALAKLWAGRKLDEMGEKFKEWKDGIREKLDDLKAKFNEIKDRILAPFKKAWEEIGDAIFNVIGIVGQVKDALGGLKIPEPFQRHSPPPFAQSLTDISDAMRRLSRLDLPEFRGQLGALGNNAPSLPVGAPTPASGQISGRQVVFEAGAIQINDRSAAEFFVDFLRGEADADTFGGLAGGEQWP